MGCEPGKGFLCLLLLSLDSVRLWGVLWECTTQLLSTSSKSLEFGVKEA